MLSYMIGNKIDILTIRESKLDDTSQFVIDSFTEPSMLDHTRIGVVYYFMLKITLLQQLIIPPAPPSPLNI